MWKSSVTVDVVGLKNYGYGYSSAATAASSITYTEVVEREKNKF
jgi:hypothetical protein